MTRSPAGPPFRPRPPCPFILILPPVSVPGGTLIRTFFLLLISPRPAHVLHGSVGTWPLPRQTGHGRFTANPPCANDSTPRPLHSAHTLTALPGAPPDPPHVAHCSLTSISTGTLPPRTAVRKGTSSTVSTDCPCSGPRDFCFAAPPPNIEPNRSPSPPSPPMSKSSKLIDDPPRCCDAPRRPRVKPSNAPRLRISSYFFLFSASPSTLCASEISLNRSAAFGSLLFASGWYCLASLR